MYAKYQTLFADCAYTDSTRFSCVSLPTQPLVRRSIQSELLEPSDIVCNDGECPAPNASCRYESSSLPPSPQIETFKMVSSASPQKKTRIARQTIRPDPDALLPVLNPKFNMREICKQCILLEDHLSHTEKRCSDCCIKHFLTIEALAEEAVTLDKDQSVVSQQIRELPGRVRSLQKKWFQDPDNSAHSVSQELRKIRKDFQIDCFDVVFNDSCDCNEGVCRIKK